MSNVPCASCPSAVLTPGDHGCPLPLSVKCVQTLQCLLPVPVSSMPHSSHERHSCPCAWPVSPFMAVESTAVRFTPEQGSPGVSLAPVGSPPGSPS